jgi:tripartite-type tricarboxylate transporter receptor subunit TctC
VQRLNAETTGALNDEAIRTNMRNLGVEPMPTTPEAFEAYIRSETTKWAKVIHQANIKLD